MPLTVPVNNVAECLRTDCYILGDKKNILMYNIHVYTFIKSVRRLREGVVGTGWSWLRIGTGGWHL